MTQTKRITICLLYLLMRILDIPAQHSCPVTLDFIRLYDIKTENWAIRSGVVWNKTLTPINGTCWQWEMIEKSYNGSEARVIHSTATSSVDFGSIHLYPLPKIICKNGRPQFNNVVYSIQLNSTDCWCTYKSEDFGVASFQHDKYPDNLVCHAGLRGLWLARISREYQECGNEVKCSGISSQSGPGCYCGSDLRAKHSRKLDPVSGMCVETTQVCTNMPSDQRSSTYTPSLLNARPYYFVSTPTEVVWITMVYPSYNCYISEKNRIIPGTGKSSLGLDGDERFQIYGQVGQLTLPKEVTENEGEYSLAITGELFEEVSFIVTDSILDRWVKLGYPLDQPVSNLSGAVQMYLSSLKVWALLCVDEWSRAATNVVCRQMDREYRYNGSFVLSGVPTYANVSTAVKTDYLFGASIHCKGSEYELNNCDIVYSHSTICLPHQVVQVKCTS